MAALTLNSSETASPTTCSFGAEEQLLCLCARPELKAAQRERLDFLLADSLDWDAVLDGADLHGVTGMLYHHLARHEGGRVPTAVLAHLQRRAQGIQLYNMQVMTELMRIAGAFREQGLPLLTYKGPLLAHRYYGSVALRRFGDVDVLVPRGDLERAKDLLVAQGYVPLRGLSDEQEATWHDAQLGYELYHEGKNVVVEVHWALLNRTMTVGLAPEEVWARAEVYSLGDTSVQGLAPDDLLLYLCAHGTKHHWSRLLWACDVAQVLRGHSGWEWDALLRRARGAGSLRTLLLGLALASRWLDAALPEIVWRQIDSDATVGRLVAAVEARWFGTVEGLHRPAGWAAFWFAYRTRTRLRDRGGLLAHYAWLAVTPTERDHAFVALPPSLDGLYYLLRPLRLLRDAGRGLAQYARGRITSKSTRHVLDSV